MLLNKCSLDYCSGVSWLTTTLDSIELEKTLYHLPLSTGLTNDYVIEVNAFVNKKITGLDGIILDCTGEAPEVARFQELIDILLTAGYTRNQILCIDSSIDFCKEFSNVILPNWIGSLQYVSNLQQIEPLSSRNTLFLLLARLPKLHRVRLVVKFLENELDKFSIISCGSSLAEEGERNDLFDSLVPAQFRNRFPMVLDDSRVDRHTGSTTVEERFKKCLINVVVESCFENCLYGTNGPDSHSWDRLFYTEKTDKCFYMGQIPVFLAKKGYATMLRDVYGFDIFDDIVDHSYDNIVDPMARIDAVAQECTRLSAIGMNTIQSTPGLIERFEYNKNQISVVRSRLFADSVIIFNDWIRGL